MSLEGALTLVTGSASGIGQAVVAGAKDQGSDVVAVDVADSGQAIADAVGATFLRCDVSDLDAWLGLAETIKGRGPLKYVHLNAGIQIAPPEAPLDEYQFGAFQLDRYRRMMGVNVDGVVFGLHALLPLMSEGGAVVVTSSLAGIVPYGVDPLYAMSKHAVSGLVRSLAGELGKQDIRVNALCPGAVDTGIIPNDQRSDQAVFMTPEALAAEALRLFGVEETGKTWAKVDQATPAFIIRAPGDKKKRD